MKKKIMLFANAMFLLVSVYAQQVIPIDTSNFDINAEGYVIENYKGKNAIYLHNGEITLNNVGFLNGTIEYDIYMTERRGFPGVVFRRQANGNHEEFYLRPHQTGNPDANQATPVTNGLAGWQLYYGPAYSFAYDYNFDEWTHVKLVVKDRQAQVFLDYSEKPHLSWNLKQDPKPGDVAFTSSLSPMHYANIICTKDRAEFVDFEVAKIEPIKDIVPEWSISDKFEEIELNDVSNIKSVIDTRTWKDKINVEENNIANIGYVATRYDGTEDNTVFAKIEINSDKDQIKLFHFGYSDRVVAILNEQPIYHGTNRFSSRDYRYLGTVGLFDAIYLPLNKGKNTLLFAVSEDFGGWGITGKFDNPEGVKIK